MGYAIPKEIILETEECCNCGILFAMPDYMMKRLQDNGGSFYCPNGHSQHYTETDKTRLNRMRKTLDDQMRETNKAMERAKKAEKEVSRLKKRASAGVCPCCNRTFQNLMRHMKSQLPDFAEKKPATKKKRRVPIKSKSEASKNSA